METTDGNHIFHRPARHLPDVVDSVIHRYKYPRKLRILSEKEREDEEEESHTIGGSSSSSLTHSIGQLDRQLSFSPPPLSPLCTTPPPPPSPPCKSSVVFSHSEHMMEKPVQSMQERRLSQDLVDRDPHHRSTKGHSPKKRMAALRSLFKRAIASIYWVVSWIVLVIHRGMEPLTKKSALISIKVEQKRSPLTNVLFCLGSKVSERHCPQLWACGQETQLALLVLMGGGMERFMWRELRLVTHDEENWARSLYILRHTLWPGGVFMKKPDTKPTEAELEMLKRKAADSFKMFLPGESFLFCFNFLFFLFFFPYFSFYDTVFPSLTSLQIFSLTLLVRESMTRQWCIVWST